MHIKNQILVNFNFHKSEFSQFFSADDLVSIHKFIYNSFRVSFIKKRVSKTNICCFNSFNQHMINTCNHRNLFLSIKMIQKLNDTNYELIIDLLLIIE